MASTRWLLRVAHAGQDGFKRLFSQIRKLRPRISKFVRDRLSVSSRSRLVRPLAPSFLPVFLGQGVWARAGKVPWCVRSACPPQLVRTLSHTDLILLPLGAGGGVGEETRRLVAVPGC